MKRTLCIKVETRQQLEALSKYYESQGMSIHEEVLVAFPIYPYVEFRRGEESTCGARGVANWLSGQINVDFDVFAEIVGIELPEPVVEYTLQEIADKFNIPVEQLRIKK